MVAAGVSGGARLRRAGRGRRAARDVARRPARARSALPATRPHVAPVLGAAARPAIVGVLAACVGLWAGPSLPAAALFVASYVALLLATRTVTAADLARWRGGDAVAVFARGRTCGTRPAAEACRVPKTIVVIPTYNERENVPRLIPQVLAQAPDLEVLVVDDQSPDGTGALVAELGRAGPARPPPLAPRPARGSARRTRTASRGRSRTAPTSSSRWTPTSRTRPR